jgi:hypothetical protein
VYRQKLKIYKVCFIFLLESSFKKIRTDHAAVAYSYLWTTTKTI